MSDFLTEYQKTMGQPAPEAPAPVEAGGSDFLSEYGKRVGIQAPPPAPAPKPEDAVRAMDSRDAPLDVELGFRPAPPPPPEVAEVLGGWTGDIPTNKVILEDGRVVDQADRPWALEKINSGLRKRELEALRSQPGGLQAVTPEDAAQRLQEMEAEAEVLVDRWLVETGGASHPVLQPQRAVTKEKDDADLAAGLLPEGRGNIAGKAREVQDFLVENTKGVEGVFPGVKPFADVFWPGLFTDEGAIGTIPERVGPIPARALSAMIYPYHGYEVSWKNSGNLLHKMAQDFVAPVMATGETTKLLMEEDSDLTYFQARRQARTDVRTIQQVRGDKSAYDYAVEDEVGTWFAPWLTYRVLTGDNLMDEMHKSLGLDVRDYPVLGWWLQSPRRAQAKVAEAIGAEGYADFVTPSMTSRELETQLLGPLAVAVSTPDILVGGMGVAKSARGLYKTTKGAVFGAAMEKNATALEKLAADVEAAVASGKSDDEVAAILGEGLAGLKARDLHMQNEVAQQLRRTLGLRETTESSASIAKRLETLTRNSERSQKTLESLIEQIGARQGTPIPLPPITGGAPYKPLFLKAQTPATRKGLAQAELTALQSRHAGAAVYEKVLGRQVKQLRSMGLLADRAAPGKKAGEALAKFRSLGAKVEQAIEDVAVNGLASDKTYPLLVQYQKAYEALIRESSAMANVAVYEMLQATTKTRIATAAHMEGLYSQLHKAPFTSDQVQGLKAGFDLQLSRMVESAEFAAPLTAGTKGELVRVLKGMAESAKVSAAKLKSGTSLSGMESLPEFYRIRKMKPPEALHYLKKTFGADAWQGMLSKPPEALKALTRNEEVPARELSALVRDFAQRAKADPFSAWSMSSHLSGVEGLRVRGKGATYNFFATMERTFQRLKLSGLLRKFGVGKEDMLSVARHGAASMRIGGDDLAAAQKIAVKRVSKAKASPEEVALLTEKLGRAPKKGEVRAFRRQEAVLLEIKRFIQDPEFAGTSLFRSGSGSTPLAEAVNAWRAMGAAAAVEHASFRVTAKAFLGKGQQTGVASQSAIKQLEKLIFDDPTAVLAYDDFVKHGQRVFGDAFAGAKDLRSNQALAYGILNASSTQRMFDAAAVKMAGFDGNALGVAIDAIKQTGKPSAAFSAEARGVLEAMGIPSGMAREVTKESRLAGISVVKNADDALVAIVPRNYLNSMGDLVKHLEKAPDAAKGRLGFLQRGGISTAVQRGTLLMRWGLTTGLLLPKPSYFYKNLMGAMSQVGVTASVDQAAMAAIAAGSPISYRTVRSLFTGMPKLDAKIAGIYQRMVPKSNGQAILPPPNIGMHNRFVRGMLDDLEMPADTRFSTIRGEVLAKGDLVREMTQGGVFSTQAKAFLLEDASRVVERSFKATPGSFWDKGWDVISRRPQKFAGWMDTLESHQRVALYLDARLRKGLSAEASSRLVREAYFDWTYPANLFGETAFMGLPVLMFGSMWKNAATHTIQALMDPRKAKRMMDMFKAADIGTDFYSEDTTSMFPMEMDRFAKEMAWWSGKSGQLFVTEGASDEEAQSGVMFQGGPTTTMAWSTPGALNHDLLVLGANTALSTAIMVNDLGHTPRSHENIERYQQNLGMAMATFMNPITAGALGLGSPYKSYDGKMKITPAEYALYNRMGWGDPEYKVNEDYGGGKFRANQGTVRATRLMPGINRIIRDMDPVVRQQMGDPSVDLLHDLVAIEMGAKPYPIMGGAAEHVKRRNILEGKAKDLSR